MLVRWMQQGHRTIIFDIRELFFHLIDMGGGTAQLTLRYNCQCNRSIVNGCKLVSAQSQCDIGEWTWLRRWGKIGQTVGGMGGICFASSCFFWKSVAIDLNHLILHARTHKASFMFSFDKLWACLLVNPRYYCYRFSLGIIIIIFFLSHHRAIEHRPLVRSLSLSLRLSWQPLPM